VPGAKSIAMGYMRAHKRQRKAYSMAYALYPDKHLDDSTAEEIWIELFEELAGRSTALTRGGGPGWNQSCARGVSYLRIEERELEAGGLS
jgi:hypothetical protein